MAITPAAMQGRAAAVLGLTGLLATVISPGLPDTWAADAVATAEGVRSRRALSAAGRRHRQ